MSETRWVPLLEPSIGGNARRYIDQCITTNFVSSVGPFVERFEREFAAYVGSKYAVVCVSGTAAIHLALRLLGVGPGDEVMVPDLTFVATANPILYERATPILVDSERETWNIDPNLVIEDLDRRARSGCRLPKAVVVAHLLGHPAQIEPIHAACERHGVAIVEDACESLGARWKTGRFADRHVGTVGALGCFSFNGNKVLTTGGGGMVTTDNESLARRAKHLSTQARVPNMDYFHDEVGYNYRLTNLAAALGVAQLEQLPVFLVKKQAIGTRYDNALRGLDGITLAPRVRWAAPSMWLYTVLVDPSQYGCDREALKSRLDHAGIESRSLWTPLHRMPMYRDATCLGTQVASELFDRGLSLPSSVDLDEEAQDRVVALVRERAGTFHG